MPRVLHVALAPDASCHAALAWLEASPEFTARSATPADAAAAVREFSPAVVWLDGGPPLAAVPAALSPVLHGEPPLLLTGCAALLPSLAGRERVPPESIDRVWRDAEDDLFFFDTFSEAPRLRGHAAFRQHPLFDGLGSGAYTWWPAHDERWSAVRYRAPAWPQHGRVIAVERAYIHIEAGHGTIWEHVPDAGAPRMLCIGAYLDFAARAAIFRPAVERLAGNALRLLARGSDDGRAHYWHLPCRITSPDATPPPLEPPSLGGRPLPFELAPLALAGGDAADPFTLAGRRVLVTGHEGGGIAEVWTHPLRIVRDLRVTLDGEPLANPRVCVTSLGVERHHDGAGVIERVAAAPDTPAALLEWTAARARSRLDLTWETDLRLMWPYPAGVLGPLRWHVHGRALTVRADFASEIAAFITSDETCAWQVHDTSTGDAPRLRITLSNTLSSERPLRVVLLAAGSADALSPALASLRDPAALIGARAAAQRRLRAARLSIATPEPDLDAALEWAKVRLDSYLVDTPAVGRSLVAGYWQSSAGWGDGRPGYAWYFGRDAVWTALASLAAGDFGASRDVLSFFARHQDLSGKILHEATTSGTVHYDSADATPLYLLLAARHFAWTGDIDFLRTAWPNVRRALAFCRATDLDDDGLIENTGVGHGWIEFGRLGGGRVTYYNAGIWVAALRELAVTAEAIGEPADAVALASQAKRARIALERLFHDATRGYALKAWTGDDGAWLHDFTPTATHAVPLLLGVADADSAAGWLDRVASEDFSAPWGVRMLARSDPGYDPRSYHGGAVWPLYTGWVSWAELAAGRAASGIAHWRANVGLCAERQKGAWDEVLHGEERRSAGVCPDQAWSTAMVVAPLVYGMLGAEPDAARMRLRLRPQLPLEWARFSFQNLAMGDALFSLDYSRDGQRHTFSVEQTGGAVPARLIFEPALPGERLCAATVDGRPAALDAHPFGERMLIQVQLTMDHERIVMLEVEPALPGTRERER